MLRGVELKPLTWYENRRLGNKATIGLPEQGLDRCRRSRAPWLKGRAVSAGGKMKTAAPSLFADGADVSLLASLTVRLLALDPVSGSCKPATGSPGLYQRN